MPVEPRKNTKSVEIESVFFLNFLGFLRSFVAD